MNLGLARERTTNTAELDPVDEFKKGVESSGVTQIRPYKVT
jgi:hypothetical protein